MDRNLFSLLLISIICIGCSVSTLTPPSTIREIITVQPSPTIPMNSFSYTWEMIDQPVSIENGFSIFVYAMRITGQDTTIISSVIETEAVDFSEESTSIQLEDNLGVSSLISKSKLGQLGPISFWAMKFEPRNIGAESLYFQIVQNIDNAYLYNTLIANFAQPPEDPSLHNVRSYLIGTSQTFSQDDYKISFEGWVPPPITGPSATASLPIGVTIKNNVTLRTEELSTKVTNYLKITFYSNGEISGELVR